MEGTKAAVTWEEEGKVASWGTQHMKARAISYSVGHLPPQAGLGPPVPKLLPLTHMGTHLHTPGVFI